jgi:hypothetical protein
VITSFILGFAALVGVVLLGAFYGSPAEACRQGLPFAQRGWQLTAAFWALNTLTVLFVVVLLVVIGAVLWDWDILEYSPIDVVTHLFFWCGFAVLVGGFLGWNLIAQHGWTCAGA